MIPLYNNFVNSIAIADRNVLIIFGIALLAITAWYGIALLPHTWHKPARLIAWIYAVLVLTITVYYSGG